jgi:hypothetical protein
MRRGSDSSVCCLDRSVFQVASESSLCGDGQFFYFSVVLNASSTVGQLTALLHMYVAVPCASE